MAAKKRAVSLHAICEQIVKTQKVLLRARKGAPSQKQKDLDLKIGLLEEALAKVKKWCQVQQRPYKIDIC